MKYKAMISDIDGTLGPVSLMPIPSEKVTSTIQKAISSGFIFTLATGKPFSLVEYLIPHLHLQAPIIVDNGAAIYDPISKKQIIEYIIENEVAQEILNIIRIYSKEYRISCNNENYQNILQLSSQMKVRKFVVLDLSLEQADKLIKEIEKRFKTLHVVKTSSDLGKQYYSVYISSGEASKQHAVLSFATLMGISPSEIIGIGDHYNDFPLLMACGLKVAMGNAVSDLKAIADYIAPPVEKDGLAHVLEKYIIE